MPVKNRLCMPSSLRRLVVALAAAVLPLVVGCGCTRIVQARTDLVWREYPGYERVKGHCYLVVDDSVRSFAATGHYGFGECRVLFGESLAASLPGALSKVFDRVTVSSSAAEAKAGSADAVVLRISSITGHITPPATRLSEARAHLCFRVEMRSQDRRDPLIQELRGDGRSISESRWPEEVANGAVEAAGNALTQYISASRESLTGSQAGRAVPAGGRPR